jgi:hypothetical protein
MAGLYEFTDSTDTTHILNRLKRLENYIPYLKGGVEQPPAVTTAPVAANLNREPLILNLADVSFAALNTWYTIVPATVFTLPRSTKSLIAIMISIHLTWTAASASQALCDWSVDGQVHYMRTLHMIVSKQDDSTVNGAQLTFPVVSAGTNSPSVSVSGRQIVGALGLSVIGGGNTTWPALDSKAAIIDLGPTL